MPFYEYQCRACGKQLEVMQKISDAPLRKCPQCGKSQLQKLISAPVFRLKGGGWYETDFKGDSDNKRNLVSAEKDDSSSGATKEALPVPAADKADKAEKKAEPAKPAAAEGKASATASKTKTAAAKPVAARKPAVKKTAARSAGGRKAGR